MKTLTELRQDISVVYSSDIKMVPTGPGGNFRKVRARRIKLGDAAPSSEGIRAPDFTDAENTKQQANPYTKEYKEYLKNSNRQLPKLKEFVELTGEPPFVLVLKRKNIRLFPNNLKVALYYNEKIDKYFTVPFAKDDNTVVQAEEQDIVSNILNVFINLDEEQKEIMLSMINESEESYNKIKQFALSQSYDN